MARKWRPESFSDLVGQEHVARTIANAIQADRIHHAFLFTGTRGVGKTTSARILARTLNCQGPDPLHPCGKCGPCREIASGTSLDVVELDGASNNSVDDVRNLIEQAQYAPMTGKYKVYVVDEVHMLSKSAFNALLKTLEEPPPHVVFVFATTEVNKVPPTILSRVLRFDFRRIGPRHIQERLEFICSKEGIEAEGPALALISELADGSMRDALTLFDQVYAFTGKSMTLDGVREVTGVPAEESFFRLAEAVFSHDQGGVLAALDTLVQGGTEIPLLLEGFSRFLRNLLFARSGAKDAAALLHMDAERFGRFANLAPDVSAGDILRAGRILSDTQMLVRHSPNPRLQAELAFCRMAFLDRVADLRRLIGAAGEEPAVKKKTDS